MIDYTERTLIQKYGSGRSAVLQRGEIDQPTTVPSSSSIRITSIFPQQLSYVVCTHLWALAFAFLQVVRYYWGLSGLPDIYVAVAYNSYQILREYTSTYAQSTELYTAVRSRVLHYCCTILYEY